MPLDYMSYKNKHSLVRFHTTYSLREVLMFIREGRFNKVTIGPADVGRGEADLVVLCDGSGQVAMNLLSAMLELELVDSQGNVNNVYINYFLKAMEEFDSM